MRGTGREYRGSLDYPGQPNKSPLDRTVQQSSPKLVGQSLEAEASPRASNPQHPSPKGRQPGPSPSPGAEPLGCLQPLGLRLAASGSGGARSRRPAQAPIRAQARPASAGGEERAARNTKRPEEEEELYSIGSSILYSIYSI